MACIENPTGWEKGISRVLLQGFGAGFARCPVATLAPCHRSPCGSVPDLKPRPNSTAKTKQPACY